MSSSPRSSTQHPQLFDELVVPDPHGTSSDTQPTASEQFIRPTSDSTYGSSLDLVEIGC